MTDEFSAPCAFWGVSPRKRDLRGVLGQGTVDGLD